MLRELFSEDQGCGFNYCRLPIGASDYAESWYSHCEHPGDFNMEHFSIERDHRHLLPYIRAAAAHQPNLTLFASPWSPPTWLKNPSSYNYGKLIWEPSYLEAYALYFTKFVEAYAKEGIKIDAVHVQNEPDSDQKFPSCLWTGERLRDFIRDYLGPKFEREHVDCQIWAGTIERADFNAWVNTILTDDAARKYVKGVGFQWAGKGAVQLTRLSWPDMPIIQTENECGDGQNNWQYAQYVFDLIHHYLLNGAEAYVYWNMVLPLGGESTWGWKQNSMLCVDTKNQAAVFNPEFYIMKHFAAFVQPGDRVNLLKGPLAGNAMAFVKPDGRRTHIIKNPFPHNHSVRIPVSQGVVELKLAPHSIHTFAEG